MFSQTRSFDIHLSGLIQTLSESLYSKPDVAVRELVQNAVDSCTRRRAEDIVCPDDLGVWVVGNHRKGILIVRDSGAGLTEKEIARDLATIGVGATRTLRERLERAGSPLANQLIGQFGVGFLSAFMLAEEAIVETRSYFGDKSEKGWRFIAKGNKDYHLEPIERSEIGSTVKLKLKPEFTYILESKELQKILSYYASLLPVPIYVGRKRVLINDAPPPWQCNGNDSSYRRYISERTGLRILEVIPVHIREGGMEAKGVLAIPASSDLITGGTCDLEVYVRHMYIGRERGLLPPWASCVVGVIDTPSLTPTASREAVMQNEAFRRMRTQLGKTIVGHLRYLANNAPERLGKIMAAHHVSLKAWAIADRELLGALGDHLPFRSSMGTLPLRACVEVALGQTRSPDHNRPTLLFRTEGHNELIDQLVLGPGNRLVIDASGYPDADILRAYAQVSRRVDIRNIADLDPIWFGNPESCEGARRLVEWYEKQGTRTRVSALDPEEAPALFLINRGEGDSNTAPDSGILVLNSANLAVKRLIASDDLNPYAKALALLEHQAYVAATPNPNPKRLREAFLTLTKVLLELIPENLNKN